MFSLYIKEIKSFLSSIIGYIFMGVFLIISGLFLWVFPNIDNVLESGLADLQGLFSLSQFLFLFLVPAITMRSFAEERRTGTMDLLLTKPLTDMQIIWAKFLSCLTLLLIALIPTLIYVISIYFIGNPVGNIDMGSTWGSYLGLLFLGATFIAIGLFASSLTNNQIIAFIIAAPTMLPAPTFLPTATTTPSSSKAFSPILTVPARYKARCTTSNHGFSIPSG